MSIQHKTKECPKCGKTFPLTEEYFSPNVSSNTGGSGPSDSPYLRPECRKCTSSERKKTNLAKKLAGNPEKPPMGTPCDNCKKVPTRKDLVFDHDHVTLAHRGWLCDSCNRAIGMLGDTVDGLQNAINYLNRHKKEIP